MSAATSFDCRSIPADAAETKWRAADGHEIRSIAWPAPPDDVERKGSILFMAGRGDAYEKYLESFEHWRLQGWQVTACDWRGQGGSGRFGNDATTGHIDDFSLWIADLAEFWAGWSEQNDGPLVLMGHSMGGHLVLRAAIEEALEPRPDALVLSAPMLDTFPEAVPMPVKRGLAWVMNRVGDPKRPAWKISERPATKAMARRTLLTHDDERYEDELWWREERPELALGPGSWGWVKSAADSSAAMFRRGALESVAIPTFIVATEADRLVSASAIRSALARMPHIDSLIFGSEARHEILRETDSVREKALAAIDRFLEDRLG